jgi:putative ABC transport system ATP-binding protein
MSDTVIDMKNIKKYFWMGDQKIEVLQWISLTVSMGEYISIMWVSWSGKSTLMNVIGLLDIATSGTYALCGEYISDMEEDALSMIRRTRIGFVFQSYNLMKKLPARQQVALPLAYQGVPLVERKQRAIDQLHAVGLWDRINNLPNQLSWGQQQRVCIARALVTNPSILLADEPTGALDSTTSKDVMDLFDLLSQQGKTLIVITHDEEIAKRATTLYHIKDGNFI